MRATLEAALSTADDRRDYDELLRRIHEDTFSGATPPAHPRSVIDASWRRLRRRGLRTDRRAIGPQGAVEPDDDSARLLALLPQLRQHLSYLTQDDSHLFVLGDAKSRVVHLESGPRLREAATDLGFLPGADWSEENVGTNGVGTAVTTRRPVHVHGAEHYLLNQHTWSCAGAPIRDPRTGRALGAITISVERQGAHPHILGLASVVAQTAHLELRERHQRHLGELRTSSWKATRGLVGTWAVVDEWGWLAAARGVNRTRRILLPAGFAEGSTWVAPLGEVLATRLGGGGWLLIATDPGDLAPGFVDLSTVTVTSTASGALVLLRSANAEYEFDVTPRQLGVLRLLAEHPEGLTARQLSTELYGGPEHDVTVRAEISRLRRRFGEAIIAGPYRFAPSLAVAVL